MSVMLSSRLARRRQTLPASSNTACRSRNNANIPMPAFAKRIAMLHARGVDLCNPAQAKAAIAARAANPPAPQLRAHSVPPAAAKIIHRTKAPLKKHAGWKYRAIPPTPARVVRSTCRNCEAAVTAQLHIGVGRPHVVSVNVATPTISKLDGQPMSASAYVDAGPITIDGANLWLNGAAPTVSLTLSRPNGTVGAARHARSTGKRSSIGHAATVG